MSASKKILDANTEEIFKKQREKVKQEAKDRYESNPRFCQQCKEKIPYEKRKWADKYCSRKCSAIENNGKKRSDRAVTKCLGCENTFIQTKISYRKKFCSIKCQQALARQEAMKLLVDGKLTKLKNPSLRRLLIEKFSAKCMECGWDKVNPHTGKCPIELEHIDGNSENNVLENLKLLCPSCHSLTATYKGLNRGKGRHKRRQRYQEGKSY